MTIAKLLATELKASLQILLVLSKKERQVTELQGIEETPIEQMRGDFVKKVGGKLKEDDLLMLEVSTHPSRLSRSAVGVEPEAIAHSDGVSTLR